MLTDRTVRTVLLRLAIGFAIGLFALVCFVVYLQARGDHEESLFDGRAIDMLDSFHAAAVQNPASLDQGVSVNGWGSYQTFVFRENGDFVALFEFNGENAILINHTLA